MIGNPSTIAGVNCRKTFNLWIMKAEADSNRHRSVATIKEAKIFIGMSNYLEYGLFYKTVLPEDYDESVNSGKVPRCTKEMASEHFNKIVQSMENLQ
ncbi:MAG TPA: hypothetical protein PK178_08740 [Smithellaceae bacterium]|nr:hypothetical protein [Smithellaceae bacterium]